MEIIVIAWIDEQGGLHTEAFSDEQTAASCLGYVLGNSSYSTVRKFNIKQPNETAKNDAPAEPADIPEPAAGEVSDAPVQ